MKLATFASKPTYRDDQPRLECLESCLQIGLMRVQHTEALSDSPVPLAVPRSKRCPSYRGILVSTNI